MPASQHCGGLAGDGAEALVPARGYSAQAQPADAAGQVNRKEGKVLHPDLINENIKKAQYAVRGELYNRAVQLAAEGKEIMYTNGERGGAQGLGATADPACRPPPPLLLLPPLPLPALEGWTPRGVDCPPDTSASPPPSLPPRPAVGNPQALGQKPLTFNRQVTALLAAPFLMDHPLVGQMFPPDVITRAKAILKFFGGACGAYTDSRGAPGIRKEIAEFIQERDGYPANPEVRQRGRAAGRVRGLGLAGQVRQLEARPGRSGPLGMSLPFPTPNPSNPPSPPAPSCPQHIFITDGASVAVRYMLNALISGPQDAILVPIPQYPLYSAAIQLYGGQLLPYELKETSGWSMDLEEIRRSVREARARGVNVRALAFINPGNPTGQCLTADNLADLVRFAHDEGVVLLADEVYQPNIYQDEKPFVSAKSVMSRLGAPYAASVELASFHTVSKGVLGECGLRGGYVELCNFHPGTIDELYKVASVNLCPNTIGQAALSMMVNPPRPGDASYAQYQAEKDEGLASLR